MKYQDRTDAGRELTDGRIIAAATSHFNRLGCTRVDPGMRKQSPRRCGNFPNHREIIPLGADDGRGFRLFGTGVCGTALALCPLEEISMQQSAAEKFYDWVRLIQSEYVEMPGLHLSKRQAQRLWNLDARSTDMIFEALEASNFLRRMPNDMYIRADVNC